jgi:broad specificity phosphatase PhoE
MGLPNRSTATFWSSASEEGFTRILLIRHGRVAWNAKSAYTGWTDIPLDDRGLREAALTAERLKSVDISAVYSSDLSRARETARIIACPHDLRVEIEPDLKEINYGQWEGLGAAEIKSKFGEAVFKSWSDDPENVRIPGGETFGELRDRTAPAVDRIVAIHSSKTVAVVAHKSTNRVLICNWLGLGVNAYKRIEQDNSAINSAIFRGNRVVVETVNDVCHIRD